MRSAVPFRPEVLCSVLLLAVLGACSAPSPWRTAAGATVGAATSGAGRAPGSAALSLVSCSGGVCSVTLRGTGSRAQVLGTSIALEGIRHGRAVLRVAGRSVSCTRGRDVRAGTLVVTCTALTTDTVTLTAARS